MTASFRARVYWRALSELENVVIIEEPPELHNTDVVTRVMTEWKTRGFQVTRIPRESKYILHLR
jgi:hypothetical protein